MRNKSRNLRVVFYLLANIFCITNSIQGQEASETDLLDLKSFRSSQFINCPTTTVIPHKGFQFSIRHRFGEIDMSKSIITDFLGMDKTANIQFSFGFAIGKKNMVTVGRTKVGKQYHVEGKRTFIQQNELQNPVSISGFAAVYIKSGEFNKEPLYSYFSDNTEFKNKFEHRFTYDYQLIFSRKFNSGFSSQVSLEFFYQNLANKGVENLTFMFPIAISYCTKENSSVLFEYVFRFNNTPENNLYPISLGYEFGTVGHVFQLIVSSSMGLTPDYYSLEPQLEYDKGKFLLGFNLIRTFYHRKSLQKYLRNKDEL
ncbi:MAG TPA: DUF5777 family beta-barrel protein [Bacteroidia bacterium]|nr:DUF5777 family beta-barrel protein [Bacteroidia bacterium]HNT80217.1 DUF5777 family beta-barrel protein [Bacteroidia bacterium]